MQSNTMMELVEGDAMQVCVLIWIAAIFTWEICVNTAVIIGETILMRKVNESQI